MTPLLKYIVIPIIISMVITQIVTGLTPYDETDDEVKGLRSGVKLITDHGTGCQYLTRFFGSPTPRLNKNGKHMCGDFY